MPTLTQEQQKVSATYKMPDASIGMPVLWFMDGIPSTKPFAGIVINATPRTVDIEVHSPNGGKKMVFGVRHHTDPLVSEIETFQSGAWGHTEESHRLRRLEAYVKDLMHDLAPAASLAD